MLPVRSRLRRSNDIRAVLRTGKRIRLSVCTVSVVRKAPDVPSRIAVVVGKRVSSSAVRRHRVQRLLREAGSQLLRQYPNGYDMVIVALPASSRIQSLADLEHEWEAVTRAVHKLTS